MGVDVGWALVDQGCNRSVIRLSALHKTQLIDKVHLWPVKNHWVQSATGQLVPIVSRFMSTVWLGDRLYSEKAVTYVVSNTKDNDITCDYVVGRHTMAHSNYPLIDTRTGKMHNRQDPEDYIICVAAKLIKNSDANTMGTQLVPKDLIQQVMKKDETHGEEESDCEINTLLSMKVYKEEVKPREKRRPRKSATPTTTATSTTTLSC
jgi:hypothetical protein